MARRMTDGWDEVFRAGPCVDSAGRNHNFTREDLDQIVAKYNDGSPHTAAVTIGHPTGTAPAYGWVAKLKRDDDVLLAKYSDVDPAFEEAVKAGRFKKKSVGLRADFGIDHVAYLGGKPPAIKGLKDFQFASGAEVVSYEFSAPSGTYSLTTLLRSFSDFLRNNPITDTNRPAEDTGCSAGDSCIDPNCCYHEHDKEKRNMDLKDLIKSVEALTAAQEASNKTLATFTETITAQGKTIETQGKTIAALQTQLTSSEEATARHLFEEFCDSEEMRTRITPAMKPGIVEGLMLARKGAPIEFEEAGEKKTIPAVDDYKQRLKTLPQVVQFGEFAGHDRGVDKAAGTGNAVETAKKVTAFMEDEKKSGRTVTYAQALVHVEAQANKGGGK